MYFRTGTMRTGQTWTNSWRRVKTRKADPMRTADPMRMGSRGRKKFARGINLPRKLP